MFPFLIINGVNFEKIGGCLFNLWKNVNAVFFVFFIFIFDMDFTIKDVECWYIFIYKHYANNIVLNISNMKCLLKWLVQNLVLFHCSCGNKE